MGGFVDGIVLHQILQLHNMLSARRPPDSVVNIEANMVWDGLFHAFTWVMVALGILLLFRAGRRADVPWSGRVLLGSMLAGWGLFNLVEGVVNHHILQVHHVVERLGLSVWDWVFLGSGALLVGVGWLMIRSAPLPPVPPPSPPAGRAGRAGFDA
ncbi:MAG: DUF2243 domain-containing protein [Phycisphaerae bacterium]